MPRATQRSTERPKSSPRKSTRGRTKKAPPTLRERIARRVRQARIAGIALIVVVAALDVLFLLGITSPEQIRTTVLAPFRRSGPQFITDSSAPLASFYAPAVLYWEDSIERWADEHGVNPNVIAIVMQIESCGDPEAVSHAGALGLMQVMPMHFSDGENMINPETNVRRGMGVFHECLSQFAGWDLGRALACYNGGPSVLSRPFDNWPRETRSYYRWATGMWNEVVRGRSASGTLDDWLGAGGSRLCQQALRTLSEVPPLVYEADVARDD